MINKKISLVFILALALMIVPLICAETIGLQQSMPDQPQGKNVLISMSGDINGIAFSNCTISSVRLNNGTNLISSTLMTFNPSSNEYEYILDSSNTKILGNYVARGDCQGYTWAFDFNVTPNGIENVSFWDNSFLIILLTITIILLIMAFAMKNFSLAVMSGFGFMITGVYTMINGFSNYADTYTRAGSIFLIAIGMILSAVSGYEWVTDSNENQSSFDTRQEEED